MISLNIKNCNTNSNYFIKNSLNNIIYDYVVQYKEADFSSFSCPHCSHKGTMVRNGYYSRKVNVNCKLHNIKIYRVICKECGRSHAVLPSFIIPYIQTPLNEAFIIINDYEDKKSTTPDTYRIIKSYLNWQNRLKSVLLSFKDNIVTILMTCINKFKMFILQNHKGKIYYFS